MKSHNLISIKKNNINLKYYFTRNELTKILKYYSLGVARGKWKDYSIDFTTNAAYFHFYKNCSEKALYSIIKNKIQKKNKDKYKIEYGYNKFFLSDNLNNIVRYLDKPEIKLIKK